MEREHNPEGEEVPGGEEELRHPDRAQREGGGRGGHAPRQGGGPETLRMR